MEKIFVFFLSYRSLIRFVLVAVHFNDTIANDIHSVEKGKYKTGQ
jgi:hypothetical protein